MNEIYQNNGMPDVGFVPRPAKSKTPLIIALIAVATAVATAISSVTIFVVKDRQKKAELAKIPPTLIVTSCPDQVTSDSPTVTITGVVLDNNFPCVLSIDNETVETALSPGETKLWSKSYTLTAGETRTFTITVKNENDLTDTETRSVFCQTLQDTPAPAAATATTTTKTTSSTPKVSGPLSAGCEFVKRKSGGLNIREYAGTEYAVVDFINKNDYKSRMVFTGYYLVGSDNYTWYNVITPNGKYGYVRSDLVTRVS